MQQFLVQQNEAGQRLDKLLGKILSKAPKSFLYKMLRKKNITLNGKKADGSEKLSVDDEIKLFLSDETIEQFREQVNTIQIEYQLDILYEDQHILIVNKPLGVLSQKAEKEDISMVEHITSYLLATKQLAKEQLISFKPAVCNRLDRNTGGVLIAGKSLLGLQQMAKLLQSRALSKYYLCIVKGRVEGKKRIEGYLSKDEGKNLVTIFPKQMENTEYICTEYTPIAYTIGAQTGKNSTKSSGSTQTDIEEIQGCFTLLEVKLITGRSHQIRAHLASIGHPIIGDFKYGDQKTNHYFKKKYNLTHQLLHSYRMVFPELEGELSHLSHKEIVAKLPNLFEQIKKELSL